MEILFKVCSNMRFKYDTCISSWTIFFACVDNVIVFDQFRILVCWNDF